MAVELAKVVRSNDTNWTSGEFKTDCGTFTFEAKVFEEPSCFGIPTPRYPDGGTISKLLIRDPSRNEFVAYERGWMSDELFDKAHPQYGPYSGDLERDMLDALFAEFE